MQCERWKSRFGSFSKLDMHFVYLQALQVTHPSPNNRDYGHKYDDMCILSIPRNAKRVISLRFLDVGISLSLSADEERSL